MKINNPAVIAWLAEIGAKGGKSRSPAKLAALRENAKKRKTTKKP
jgi:hypothetical protein